MKLAPPKSKISSESYHWLWYVQDDRFQLGKPLLSRFKWDHDEGAVSMSEWLDFFQKDDKKSIEKKFNRYKSEKEISTLEFAGNLSERSGENKRAFGSGQAVELRDGYPHVVSGKLELKPADRSANLSAYSDSYFLDLIMERFPYSIFFKDLESRFIRINNECAAKFGINNPDEARGKTDYDYFDASHADDAFRDEQKIIKTGKPLTSKLEKEVVSGSPSVTLWASTTKLPIYDSEKNIIGTFGITKDVTDQILTEQALKESEKKYRSIFENIHDVYYRTNREGIVTEISPSIETYSGFKREEVIGLPVSNFYYFQSDRENLIEKLKKDRIVTDFEIRLSNAEDKLMYTSVSAKVVTDDTGEVIAVEGIMRDITERKHADLKLKKTHNFFDQILNNTSEGIYVINSDFEYIYWNRMMEKISGMRQKNVLGKKPFDLFPHVNREKLSIKLNKALAGETVESADYFYEINLTNKKGWAHAHYTPLRNESGEVENVLVAISDITNRKQAEEKLRKSDETLTKLSEQVPGAIYQFQQFPDGSSCFPFASSAFHSIYEIDPADVQSDSTKAIKRIHPDDLDTVINSINNSFETLESWEIDYRVQLPKKGVRWLRGRARPEKQEDGSVIWHGYLSDITDEKQKGNELNATLNIVSEQNSRLTNFAHIVSHNLRNHAGNISSLLSLYESEKSEEESEQLLSYLNMASTRLNEAIKDLNEIIDQQSGSSKNISRVNVYEFFQKIKEILSTDIIIHNVKFDNAIPEDSFINYNPAYLESILLNLLSNAVKYRHPDREPVIKITFERTSEGPKLTVRDNGLGIDLEKHGKNLFGMYKTFHQNKDSKGIGLYITKNQVESMGGSITVESAVEKGTTFSIFLICDMARIEQEVH